jgi:DeoR/GlpR family transcriptional regulator of sugar metabolism
MHALERRRKILDLLARESFLTVDRVVELLEASPATVRRDFAYLAEQMLVVRGHGGIHRLDNAPIMGVLPFSRRKVDAPEAKDRIAREAARLLSTGDIVIIDGGTTTAPLAKYLSSQVRVITNSLPLASALNEPPNESSGVPEVYMTGGYLYPKSEVLLGPQTVLALKQYHANWTFLGCNSVSVTGVLNSNDLVVDTQVEMMERAEKVAILADHTKFNRTAMVKVCDLSKLDALVTDMMPPEPLRAALQEAEVRIIVGE